MRPRARQALGALAWGAMVMAALLWWLPTLLFAVARWRAGRLRFEVVMAIGRALVALGWPEVAARVYEAEAKRAEQELRALAGRCSLGR